jgi:CxxC-x17-CxxC domain-containing protein
MKNFKSDNRSRDRRDFSRRGFRDSGRPQLHDAICAECGKDCQVPFRPSGEKPVYCSDCFDRKGGGDNDRPRGRRDSPRRSFGGRDSRSSPPSISDGTASRLIEKIEALGTKLDKIIDLLSSAGERKPKSVGGRAKSAKKSKRKKAKKTTK